MDWSDRATKPSWLLNGRSAQWPVPSLLTLLTRYSSLTALLCPSQSAADSRGPSELSLQVHDMNELLGKLRAHMYKLDKRSAAGEAGTQVGGGGGLIYTIGRNNSLNELTGYHFAARALS